MSSKADDRSVYFGPENDLSGSDKSDNSTCNKTTSTDDEDRRSGSIKIQLAKKESENVFKLRIVVILILVIAAAGVSILVYTISRSSEDDAFNTQFEGSSTQIVEAFEAITSQRISALSSLAVAAIAHGVDHSRNWPFVALSSFQQRAFTTRSNSGVLQVSIHSFVTEDQRDEWEEYVVSEDAKWIKNAIDYQGNVRAGRFINDYGPDFTNEASQPISTYNDAHERSTVPRGTGPYLPVWEMSPLLHNDHVNIVSFEDSGHHATHANLCLATGSVVLGAIDMAPEGDINAPLLTGFYAKLLSIAADDEYSYQGDPMTEVYIPIFNSFESDREPVAVMIGLFNWAAYFKEILPPNILGVDVVLRNECYEPFTYRINGGDVVPIGLGDLHQPSFDSFEVLTDFLEKGIIADGTRNGLSFHDGDCHYTLSIYPSQVFKDKYSTSTPAIITLAVAGIFTFAIFMFFVYDNLVERRQSLILRKAEQSTAIVSSLFPKNVRDRLMQTTNETDTSGNQIVMRNPRLKSLLGESAQGNKANSQPIADLFPNCTVLFADIAGFTAWSSAREPTQVFMLLQSVYQAFDKVAARRRVFKVETIGDSYVAVTGLPEPQEMHAIIMAKFAHDCLVKLFEVTSELEVTLGPDTGDLSMRFGLHSGPVTAGVLRGDRARFQLFGDTVNTAARMESTGTRGRIQVSQRTADLIERAGKESWIMARKEVVVAKGLGVLKTFWLDPESKFECIGGSNESVEGSPLKRLGASGEATTMKNGRLVHWMTDVLLVYMKKIVARRTALGQFQKSTPSPSSITYRYQRPEGKTCLDEVVEVLTLPKFNAKGIYDSESIEIDPEAGSQLREYVEEIASMYLTNPFHNFDHACHVTMSVQKLLKRVVTPDISEEDLQQAETDSNHLASCLHDYTHGINSDPLTIFAIIFSALIHDVDHRGVSNVQLGKEEPEMAESYRNKSIAEQNSFDVAWDLLMSAKFTSLRDCLFGSQTELCRFRQVVVNIVLATDIFDKELNDLRKARWNRAFEDVEGLDEDLAATMAVECNKEVDKDLRATIVLEHIIQASDVSHTMQHWHVYIKWNRRLFKEMSLAFRAGRMEVDPANFWYEGELKFFDNYVIPLAKKLKDCQVFGVSSDEYLNYALSNRLEWEEKGKSVVAEVVESLGVMNDDLPSGIWSC